MAQVFVSKSGSNIGCHVAQIFIDIHTPHRGAKESAALLDLFAKVNAKVRVKYYKIAGTFVNDKHGRQRRSKRDADRRGRLGVRISGICSLYFAKH